MKDLAWGMKPDRPARALWGARAIYDQPTYSGANDIDIVWDRQDADGEPKARERLQAWLNKTGMPALRRLVARERLHQSEFRTVVVERGNYRLIANPRASYGYLYLCAMLVDRTQVQPAVEVP